MEKLQFFLRVREQQQLLQRLIVTYPFWPNQVKFSFNLNSFAPLDLDKTLKSFPEQRIIITQMAQERMSKDSLREVVKTDILFKVNPFKIILSLLLLGIETKRSIFDRTHQSV